MKAVGREGAFYKDITALHTRYVTGKGATHIALAYAYLKCAPAGLPCAQDALTVHPGHRQSVLPEAQARGRLRRVPSQECWRCQHGSVIVRCRPQGCTIYRGITKIGLVLHRRHGRM